MSAPAIRPPRRDELEALVAIEREAGALFTTVGMPEIAYDDPGTVPALEPFRAGGHAWVAVDADGEARPRDGRQRIRGATGAPSPLTPCPR